MIEVLLPLGFSMVAVFCSELLFFKICGAYVNPVVVLSLSYFCSFFFIWIVGDLVWVLPVNRLYPMNNFAAVFAFCLKTGSFVCHVGLVCCLWFERMLFQCSRKYSMAGCQADRCLE